ncbi:MAG: FlgD immunoglobulin-like domain containing protein, partial [Candidatus Kapaibacterium sp.]
VRSNDCLVVRGLEYNGDAQGSVSINVAGDESSSILTVTGANPAVSTSSVSISVPQTGEYSLRVFDVTGNEVATLASGTFSKGSYSYTWDGRSANGARVSNGVYFYRLTGSGVNATGSVVFEK